MDPYCDSPNGGGIHGERKDIQIVDSHTQIQTTHTQIMEIRQPTNNTPFTLQKHKDGHISQQVRTAAEHLVR